MPTILLFQAASCASHLPYEFFESLGYQLRRVCNQEQLWYELNLHSPELILFDTHTMPQDSIRLIREIRSLTVNPILVISPNNDVFDTIIALEMGADDYMAAPLVLRELQVRMRNLLWRQQLLTKTRQQLQQNSGYGQDVYFDDYHLCVNRRQLFRNQEAISLTKAEFELLQAFTRYPQQVLSRHRLMQHTHHRHGYVNERTIDVIIRRLRQKLCSGLFVTVHGEGYLFATIPSAKKRGLSRVFINI
ncbi:winged helix-turn-helix domain-containing protein [Shewanella sp. SNU WT4]|uniref:winged helix-turn-helix domain-containing protein n=1 Tax=Shewanella sp. SNU WT4 TaxID=2590015 RepID=UPI001F1070D6|nr:winged helix-turn-helix domain-containing protein [Shewanella sp. SNU WT4]